MAHSQRDPAQLRAMFGANLRQLAARYPSISDLARQLGINRTQFNRYLSGESFPRPDVLDRICTFFEVDARVLLEPVDQIGNGQDPINNAFLRDYVGAGVGHVAETDFPSGFYRFSRRSFVVDNQFFLGLVFVQRNGENTFVRGYESKEAMRIQDLPEDAGAREYRGIAMTQESGITIIVSRKNAMTCSFNYLNRVASFDNNFWVGYITRTVPETADGLRATRLVYEYLGNRITDALPAARTSRFCTADELLPFHRRLLSPETPFS